MHEHPNTSTSYWLVRKVVIIINYFSGLRYVEMAFLQLERFSVEQEAVSFTHLRIKQRSDKTKTSFMIPRNKHGHVTTLQLQRTIYLQLIRNKDKDFVNLYSFVLGGGGE